MNGQICKYAAQDRRKIESENLRTYVWLKNTMEVKRARKGCRRARQVPKPQMSSVPVIGLITENVLVPKTKSVCIKESGASRRNSFVRKTELVKPRKYNEDAMIPLLKQPPHLAKKCASKLKCSEQDGKLNECEKGKLSKIPSRLIDKSSTFPLLERFQKFLRRPEEKKVPELQFPSPIPNYLDVSSPKHEPFVEKKSLVESNNRNRMKKVDKGEEFFATRKVSHTLSVVPKRDNSSYRNENDDDITSLTSFKSVDDLQSLNWPSTDSIATICDKEIRHLLGNNVSSIPILLTVATTSAAVTTTTTKTDSFCCPEGPPIVYRNSPLTKFDVTMSRTISNATYPGGELKFPIKWSESDSSDPLQFAVFDLSASDKYLGTNEAGTTMSGDKQTDVWSSRDVRCSWKDADRPILLSVAKNPSRCYSKTEPVKNEYPCRIKYSWQVLGRGSQTSRTLLESLTKENAEEESVYDCSIKYSWQIIGIATQTSKKDFSVSECRSIVSILSPKPNPIRHDVKETSNVLPATIWRNGKKFFVLNNQCTQTFAHKESQTNCIEIHVKSR